MAGRLPGGFVDAAVSLAALSAYSLLDSLETMNWIQTLDGDDGELGHHPSSALLSLEGVHAFYMKQWDMKGPVCRFSASTRDDRLGEVRSCPVVGNANFRRASSRHEAVTFRNTFNAPPSRGGRAPTLVVNEAGSSLVQDPPDASFLQPVRSGAYLSYTLVWVVFDALQRKQPRGDVLGLNATGLLSAHTLDEELPCKDTFQSGCRRLRLPILSSKVYTLGKVLAMSSVVGTPYEGIDPKLYSPYNYIPSQSAGIAMIAVFGLSTLLHTGVALWHRMWWILPTIVLCGVLEVLGWAGRLWSYYEPWNGSPFEMQICATILAPTPLLAAIFVLFGEIIRRLGSGYSRLSAKYYTIVFCTCDVIALVVQGVGGGLAATASENGRDPNVGGNIMLGGIAFQLAVIVIFSLCMVEYFVRYSLDRPVRDIKPGTDWESERGEYTTKLKFMVFAIAFTTLVLFIRAVYRTIELTDGWGGVIISTERYFIVLDAIMIVLGIHTRLVADKVGYGEWAIDDNVHSFVELPTVRVRIRYDNDDILMHPEHDTGRLDLVERTLSGPQKGIVERNPQYNSYRVKRSINEPGVPRRSIWQHHDEGHLLVQQHRLPG
ncbi:hypothetical protein NMY22_g5879 [Coprinellus aureogranulatus]|nr:hypothetical protein NMY22_g5879 [Coprinellus aureogranulatus]